MMEGRSFHSKVFRSFGSNGYKREPCFLDFQGYNPGIFDTQRGYMPDFVGVFAGMGTGEWGSCFVLDGDMGCLGAIPPYVMVVGGDPGTPIPPLPGGRDPRDPGADRGDSGAD
jgi:hypothetical protein